MNLMKQRQQRDINQRLRETSFITMQGFTDENLIVFRDLTLLPCPVNPLHPDNFNWQYFVELDEFWSDDNSNVLVNENFTPYTSDHETQPKPRPSHPPTSSSQSLGSTATSVSPSPTPPLSQLCRILASRPPPLEQGSR
jgi:hypothetical protein